MRLDPAPLGFENLSSYFLAAKYALIALFAVWLFLLYRFRRPGVLVAGAVGLSLATWMAIELPLERLYAFAPPFDRMFNVAMVATSATGHSPFESYQVNAADLEPFWRFFMRLVLLGDPENVLRVYPYLTPAVMVLLALSLYFGLRPPRGAEGATSREDLRWELALIVVAVLLLSSSPQEQFGVFRSFWPMNYLLKPNHVLGFVLLPWWVRLWTSSHPLARTVGSGLLLALIGWVFLMHWSYLLLGLAAYPLVARWAGRPPELKPVIGTGAVALAGVLPYVLFLVVNFHWAHGGAVADKVWLQYGYEEGFYNVFSAGYEHGALFLLSLAGIWHMARRRSKQDLLWLALIAGTIAGWAGYVVSFQLDKIIEPDEFYFYTRFLLTVAAGSGAYFVLTRLEALGAPRSSSAIALLVLLLPQSFFYWWNPPHMDRYYHHALDPLPEERVRLGAWIRENTPPDAVFVAEGETALWIAALSGRRVLMTGDHRPTNDHEERKALERRLLLRPGAEALAEARTRYGVTHLAVSADYLASFGTTLEALGRSRALRRVYEDKALQVFALGGAAKSPPTSFEGGHP